MSKTFECELENELGVVGSYHISSNTITKIGLARGIHRIVAIPQTREDTCGQRGDRVGLINPCEKLELHFLIIRSCSIIIIMNYL